MIISFDIDNTLIPYSDEFEIEERTFFTKLIRAEPIRKGTIELFRTLEKSGHQIWLYTTSFRSPMNLKKTFIAYGLNPSKIINEKTNRAKLKSHNCNASKNPKLFGIDIHIDDSEGVGIEGKKYGFKTIIINPNDKDWVSKIKASIEAIETANT